MIVVFYNSGQLGNRLFYFSHFISLAVETKQSVLFFCFDEYSKYFEGTKNNRISTFDSNILLRSKSSIIRKILQFVFYKISRFCIRYSISNKFISVYTPKIAGDMDSVDYSINTIISDPTYKNSSITFFNGNYTWFDNTDLSNYREKLIPFFMPINNHLLNVDDFIGIQKRKSDLIIGVHIRRGDYRTFANGAYFFDNTTYINYMRQIVSLFERKTIIFVIASNENIEMSDFAHFSVVKSTGHLIEDMYILSKCNYIIGPPSTYSAWASFYGQKPLYHIQERNKVVQLNDFKVTISREFTA
jgi:hypothetical protein